jgi:hypothetical protein
MLAPLARMKMVRTMNATMIPGLVTIDSKDALIGVQVGVGVHVGVGMVVQVVLGTDSASLTLGDGTLMMVVVLGGDFVSVGMEDTALIVVVPAAVRSAEMELVVTAEVLVTASIGEALMMGRSAHRKRRSLMRQRI